MVGKDKKVLTLGVFAHANAGKTTITERLLYHTGIIESLGRVDSGNTVTDNLKVEKERGITVRDTLVSFELDGKNIQLIDTPGHIDFSAEVERAISVLDGAILVISGVEGIEAQTFTIWRALQEKKIPVIVFINKMDRKGANFERVLGELQKFLNIPTLTLTRVYQDNDGGLKIKHSSLDEIIEEVSLVDDEVLEHYINNNQINNELVADRIIELTRDCKLFPVIGGSALTGVGVQDLIKSIGKYIPTSIKDIDSPLSAFVYTTRVDETGKNAYVKILSGSISLKDNLKLADDKTGKVNRMYLAEGSKLTPVNTASSGDIVIINGLDVKCGDLIGARGLNNYFKNKGYQVVEPYSIINSNEDTIFTTAGIQPLFNEALIGKISPQKQFIAQPVIRTQFLSSLDEGYGLAFVNATTVSVNKDKDTYYELINDWYNLFKDLDLKVSKISTREKEYLRAWGNYQVHGIKTFYEYNNIELGDTTFFDSVTDENGDYTEVKTLIDEGFGLERIKWVTTNNNYFDLYTNSSAIGPKIKAIISAIVLIILNGVPPSNKAASYRIRKFSKELINSYGIDVINEDVDGYIDECIRYWSEWYYGVIVNHDVIKKTLLKEFERNGNRFLIENSKHIEKTNVDINLPREEFVKRLKI